MSVKSLRFLSLILVLSLFLLATHELAVPAGFFSRWTEGSYLKDFKKELREALSHNQICSRTLRDGEGRGIELSDSKQKLTTSQVARLQSLIHQEFSAYQVHVDSVWLSYEISEPSYGQKVRYRSHQGQLFLEGKYGDSKELKFSLQIPLEITTGPWESKMILDCYALVTEVP